MGSWVLAMGVAIVAMWAGFSLQHWTWEQTEAIRFHFDIENAWNQGSRAVREGYLQVYENVAAEASRDSEGRLQYGLDYPPGRLLVATLWVNWVKVCHPEVSAWENTWELNAPLLNLNRVMLLAAAAGAFVLSRHWLRRDHLAVGRPRPHVELWLPLLAGLFLWFSPAALLASFAWPQWDIWLVPFFLWALWAASVNRWAMAGALLGAGAMFKGQLLAFAPIFVLWPLLTGAADGARAAAGGFGRRVGDLCGSVAAARATRRYAGRARAGVGDLLHGRRRTRIVAQDSPDARALHDRDGDGPCRGRAGDRTDVD